LGRPGGLIRVVDRAESAPYAQSLVRRALWFPSTTLLLVGLGALLHLAPSDAAAKAPAPQPLAARGSTDAKIALGRLRAVVPPGPPPSILRLSEVRPGMVGEAFTVFSGTKPEPFRVKVVAVLRNFLPKQDIILVRAADSRVEFSGIVGGMSGSPVYVDGKLMGAIAYAWSFSKEPLGGVTPIETMLAERGRPRRASRDDLATMARNHAAAGGEAAAAAAAATGPSALARGLGLGLPAVLPADARGEARLRRVSVPLSVAGLSPHAIAELDQELRPFGLVPVQAGGGRRMGGPETPGRVEPGSALGVELIRGDVSTVAVGTVTHVDGDDVLAFGHPLFGTGEVYLPLVDAEIHAFLPSMAQSFKMSSPLHEVGTLVQDRQSCIIGDLGARTTMMPVAVRVSGAEADVRTFRAEVARNRRLTPILTSMVVGSAISDAAPDVTDMVVTVTSKVEVKGMTTLLLRDQIFSPEGVSARALAGSRGLRAVSDLLVNPFEPVVLDRMDIDVQVEYRRDVAEIVGVSLPGDVVRAGDTLPLRVTMRPYAGPEYTEIIPVVVPRSLAGDMVKIEVSSGANVKPDMAPAESLQGYLDNLRKFYTASSIVVSVQTPDDGASLRGRLLASLPASALDTLRSGSQTRRGDAYRVADRTVFPSKRLVSGRQEMTIYVREDALGRHQ